MFILGIFIGLVLGAVLAYVFICAAIQEIADEDNINDVRF